MVIGDVFRAIVSFFVKNWTIRDPRSPHRHNWRWCFFVAMDIVVSQIPIRCPKSGVIVILVNRLGDAIVSQSLVQAIRSHHQKEGESFLIIGDRSWEVLKNNLYKDIEIKFINERRFRMDLFYRLKIAIWIRSQNYRVAICFMHHRLEMRDDALVYLSGAKEKIVSGLPFLEYRWYPWLFEFYLNKMSQIIPVLGIEGSSRDHYYIAQTFERKVPHVFDRLRQFYNCLYDGELKIQQIPTLPKCNSFSTRTVIINPGAQSIERCWPLSEWVSLAYQIANKGYTVYFTGGPNEEKFIPELDHLIEENKLSARSFRTRPIIIAINQISFKDIIALFQQASCYIGPDTGGSHLAYWVGIPIVTILQRDEQMEGYHRLGDFFPYPENVLKTPYRCVWATLDQFHLRNGSFGVRHEVWEAFKELTDQAR